jgi:hypothetical protein
MEVGKVLKEETRVATAHQARLGVLENHGFGIRFGNPFEGL